MDHDPHTKYQRSARGNILILGLAKTGTTGVYSQVGRALEEEGSRYLHVYEPGRAQILRSLVTYAPEERILTKILLGRLAALELDLGHFAKRVLIHRDPRDTMVSWLLFRPLLADQGTPEGVSAFVSHLEAKEADPASVSMLRLQEVANELGLGPSFSVTRQAAALRQMIDLARSGDFHLLRYTDLVDRRLKVLGGYLDLDLGDDDQPPEWLDHIRRSSSYGAWRDWLTEEDVAELKPVLAPFYDAFDYEVDWELSAHPTITPEVSSEYVRSRYFQRTDREAYLYSPDGITNMEEFQRLLQRAEDGRVRAVGRVARHYRDGFPFMEPDPTLAHRWAYRAAIQGHRVSMYDLAVNYRDGRGAERDVDRYRFWLGESAGLGYEPAVREAAGTAGKSAPDDTRSADPSEGGRD